MTAEEWRPVVGFPDYMVSSLGRVASRKAGDVKVLAGGVTQTGYRTVLLYEAGQRVGRRVHTLVAQAFIGPRPDGQVIRHLDGDQTNNAASNLAYGTPLDNVNDAKRHGRYRKPSLESHCRRGHRRAPENTYSKGRSHPVCLECMRQNQAAYRIRRALSAANVAT